VTEPTAITRFLENPQGLVEYIKTTGDIESGFEYINLVHHLAQKLDDQLDVVLPGLEEAIEEYKPVEYKGMGFEEIVLRRTPLYMDTIMRHMRFGKILPLIPEPYRPSIERQDWKSKKRIVSLIEDGYEITENQWDRIAGAQGYQDTSEIAREIDGTTPRKQWCRFYVDDDGLWAQTSEGWFKVFEPVRYDNSAVEEHVEWVRGRAVRKLEAVQKPKARY